MRIASSRSSRSRPPSHRLQEHRVRHRHDRTQRHMRSPPTRRSGTATCGPFTMLQGDQCVPMFPPTECDPARPRGHRHATASSTCIGTGTAPAAAARSRARPRRPASRRSAARSTTSPTTRSSPRPARPARSARPRRRPDRARCRVVAYDAIAFAHNPTTTAPQATGPVYIDDCGRYRITDITPPGGPFLALGFDDAVNRSARPA